MEVLVAVGLAGNAVQFVDFSSKVVGKAYHLNKAANGCLPENADTEVVARTLYDLNSKIKDRIPLPCEGSEQILYEVCQACDQVTQELLTALQKLKVKGTNTKWKSLRHALKCVWTKEELDGMRERLDGLRSQLNLNVLTMLSERFDIVSLHHSKAFDNLEESSKAIIAAILRNNNDLGAAITDQTRQLQKIHSSESDIASSRHSMLLETVVTSIENTSYEHRKTRRKADVHNMSMMALLEEVKALIHASVRASSDFERKRLQDLSNAVTSEWLVRQTGLEMISNQSRPKAIETNPQNDLPQFLNEKCIYVTADEPKMGNLDSSFNDANRGLPTTKNHSHDDASANSSQISAGDSGADLDMQHIAAWSEDSATILPLCDRCEMEISYAHYHCGLCGDDDFDLCDKCAHNGLHCYDTNHQLTKRLFEDGKIINTSYGALAPKLHNSRPPTPDSDQGRDYGVSRSVDAVSKYLEKLGFSDDSASLPRSFVLAVGNRFSHDQIQLLYKASSPVPESPCDAVNPLFFYGTEMFPAKILQRVHGKGTISIASIARSMTVGTIIGYKRRAIKSEQWPVLVPYTSSSEIEKVYGMVLFGLDKPQRQSIDLCQTGKSFKILRVGIRLEDGTEMQIRAASYVWGRGSKYRLSIDPDNEFAPSQLLHSNALIPALAAAADEEETLELGGAEEQVSLESQLKVFGFIDPPAQLPKSLLMAISKRFRRPEVERRLHESRRQRPIFFCGPSMFPPMIFSKTTGVPLETIINSMTPGTLSGYNRHAVRGHEWPVLYPKGKKKAEVKGMVLFGLTEHLECLFEFDHDYFDIEKTSARIELSDQTVMQIPVQIHVWKRNISELRTEGTCSWSPSDFIKSIFYKEATRTDGLAEEEAKLTSSQIFRNFERVENLGELIKREHSLYGLAKKGRSGSVTANMSDSHLEIPYGRMS